MITWEAEFDARYLASPSGTGPVFNGHAIYWPAIVSSF